MKYSVMLSKNVMTNPMYARFEFLTLYMLSDLIRNINDPEHPLTLEQLNVVQEPHISVSDSDSHISVVFTPTIPHCSMATLIGLCIRVKLLHSVPQRFKVTN
jgi:metal-sulfur cluster biosynthetic enzyme